MATHGDIRIRRERAADAAAVRAVNRLAFGGEAEPALVDALRAAGAVTLSLVAEVAGRVVAHVLFSPVAIGRDADAGGTPARVVGLAPMAVRPEWQQRGVGTRLAREALRLLRRADVDAVVVLGHPDYYPRFGFVPASRYGLRWEQPCPDEAFMALELRAGALGQAAGVVRFRPEFAAV